MYKRSDVQSLSQRTFLTEKWQAAKRVAIGIQRKEGSLKGGDGAGSWGRYPLNMTCRMCTGTWQNTSQRRCWACSPTEMHLCCFPVLISFSLRPPTSFDFLLGSPLSAHMIKIGWRHCLGFKDKLVTQFWPVTEEEVYWWGFWKISFLVKKIMITKENSSLSPCSFLLMWHTLLWKTINEDITSPGKMQRAGPPMSFYYPQFLSASYKGPGSYLNTEEWVCC